MQESNAAITLFDDTRISYQHVEDSRTRLIERGCYTMARKAPIRAKDFTWSARLSLRLTAFFTVLSEFGELPETSQVCKPYLPLLISNQRL